MTNIDLLKFQKISIKRKKKYNDNIINIYFFFII